MNIIRHKWKWSTKCLKTFCVKWDLTNHMQAHIGKHPLSVMIFSCWYMVTYCISSRWIHSPCVDHKLLLSHWLPIVENSEKHTCMHTWKKTFLCDFYLKLFSRNGIFTRLVLMWQCFIIIIITFWVGFSISDTMNLKKKTILLLA